MNSWKPIWLAYYQTLSMLGRPRIWVPLAIYAGIKVLLIVFYVATVHSPLASMWSLFVVGDLGRQITSYPDDILLMPVVMNKLDMFLDVTVHVVFQGVVMCLFVAAFNGWPLTLWSAFRSTMKRIAPLLAVSVLTAGALYLSMLFLQYAQLLAPFRVPAALTIALSASAGLVIQGLFIFAMPFVLLSRVGAIEAMRRSITRATQSTLGTLVLVLVPFLPTLPLLYLELRSSLLVSKLTPEILIHLQVATELTQWVATLLLLGAVTSIFLRRSVTSEVQLG